MSRDTSASNDHEAILCCNEAGKRIEVTTDNEKVYGTVMGKEVSTSGDASDTRYAIVTDVTKEFVILNHKQLEDGIKTCEIGNKVVIELSDSERSLSGSVLH